MKFSKALISTITIGLALSFFDVTGSGAVTENSPRAHPLSDANEHSSVELFARHAYGKTALNMYVSQLNATGVNLSEPLTARLFSTDPEVQTQAQLELHDALTTRFQSRTNAALTIIKLEIAKELDDGLSKFAQSRMRPSDAHTNQLIDANLERAGTSDPRPILEAVSAMPRGEVRQFIGDLNRFLLDGTRSRDSIANEIFDAVRANAVESGITLQHLADGLNRDLSQ